MQKQTSTVSEARLGTSLAVARILIGFIFLWAFLDKLVGLGFSTPFERSWLQGGSPTTGFLSNVDGMFAPLFNNIAGNGAVDWLFMLGLLGVGTGLFLGVAMRLSILAGSAMLFLMWLAALPLATNPLIDDHLVYIAVLIVFWFSIPLHRHVGLGRSWRALPLVKKNAWLE